MECGRKWRASSSLGPYGDFLELFYCHLYSLLARGHGWLEVSLSQKQQYLILLGSGREATASGWIVTEDAV